MTEHSFEFLRQTPVATLGLTLEEYRHRVTGARHLHLDSEDGNNAFLVAFLTVPEDSTGVAHILEHTALCGSRAFPVRDPFFMMTRRSLSTFMNAFTASDWTAYPFATQSRKDFDNLLRVYLDAAFFPRLDPLDFAQEGHRLELLQPGEAASPLVYKGVVYNEMKGAMSSPTSRLWQELQSRLFPTLTYHHNSGGEPRVIPGLTYEQLKAFHARHYHPSNAVFMTYGDIPASRHQARMEELALGAFQALELDLGVADEQRLSEPLRDAISYPVPVGESTNGRTHLMLGWLLGRMTDRREAMLAELINGVLLDNSASPLRYALESSDLGRSPSDLCGLDDSTREMVFACGLEGSEPDRAQAFEDMVLGVLEDVAGTGVPASQVESVLHQLELSQREIKGGGFPYGLRLMLRALPTVLHGGDPIQTLDIDPVLAWLRERLADPAFLPTAMRRMLLDNPHRVRLSMHPEAGLAERWAEEEAAELARRAAAMSPADLDAIAEQARALEARQRQEDDPELLPRVTLADVPADRPIPEGEQLTCGRLTGGWFGRGTNGMVYQQLIADLELDDPQLAELLPVFCTCLGEVGSGGRDYRQTQALQAAVSGGVGAHFSQRAKPDDLYRTRALLSVSGKALERNHEPFSALLQDTFLKPRFDEHAKLRELLGEMCAHQESGLVDHGHVYAMRAACAGLSPVGEQIQRRGGLDGLVRLKARVAETRERDGLENLAERLRELAGLLAQQPPQLLLVGEGASRQRLTGTLEALWSGAGPQADSPGTGRRDFRQHQVTEAWAVNSQVNFCAKAYPTVPGGHRDAPALAVLGGFLQNGYLHRAIREQGGAYGAGAGYDSDTGAFRFYSYRDPRLAETLTDFDQALAWLQEERHPPRVLEEAILGVISSIDRPGSPAGEAIETFHAGLHGRTPGYRRDFRRRILEVRTDDLLRVADRYLRPELASVAVLGSLAALRNAGCFRDEQIRQLDAVADAQEVC